MSRRLIAIVALLVPLAVTAAVAPVMWPDRDGGDDGKASSSAPETELGAGPDPAAGGGHDTGGPDRATGKGLAAPVPVPEPEVGARPETPPPATELAFSPGEFALQPATAPLPVQLKLKKPPAAGVLFNVDTGEVLWQRHPGALHPMASLTKMMTALLITKAHVPTELVPISRNAARTAGSATGLLPRGKLVPLEALLEALIMISANDAAVALAEHDAGSTPRFVARMNREARRMGLTCTHFSTPNGLKDRDNHSCAADLAALARADLAEPRIARIARTSTATPAFPIKGGVLHLSNNHYFLDHGVRGLPAAKVTGLKTGYTDGAGRCYVTTARLGGRHLGVVLLDSADPLRQVPRLLAAGFVAEG
jgi:serine-type D-Ala-D-Ala carboxypeptidase (penicillin-binding protein 5/6)